MRNGIVKAFCRVAVMIGVGCRGSLAGGGASGAALATAASVASSPRVAVLIALRRNRMV
jgi:hypothetical protein